MHLLATGSTADLPVTLNLFVDSLLLCCLQWKFNKG